MNTTMTPHERRKIGERTLNATARAAFDQAWQAISSKGISEATCHVHVNIPTVLLGKIIKGHLHPTTSEAQAMRAFAAELSDVAPRSRADVLKIHAGVRA